MSGRRICRAARMLFFQKTFLELKLLTSFIETFINKKVKVRPKKLNFICALQKFYANLKSFFYFTRKIY